MKKSASMQRTTTIASNNNIPTAFKIFPILFIYLPFSFPLLILEKSTIITINMIPMRIDIAEALGADQRYSPEGLTLAVRN